VERKNATIKTAIYKEAESRRDTDWDISVLVFNAVKFLVHHINALMRLIVPTCQILRENQSENLRSGFTPTQLLRHIEQDGITVMKDIKLVWAAHSLAKTEQANKMIRLDKDKKRKRGRAYPIKVGDRVRVRAAKKKAGGGKAFYKCKAIVTDTTEINGLAKAKVRFVTNGPGKTEEAGDVSTRWLDSVDELQLDKSASGVTTLFSESANTYTCTEDEPANEEPYDWELDVPMSRWTLKGKNKFDFFAKDRRGRTHDVPQFDPTQDTVGGLVTQKVGRRWRVETSYGQFIATLPQVQRWRRKTKIVSPDRPGFILWGWDHNSCHIDTFLAQLGCVTSFGRKADSPLDVEEVGDDVTRAYITCAMAPLLEGATAKRNADERDVLRNMLTRDDHVTENRRSHTAGVDQHISAFNGADRKQLRHTSARAYDADFAITANASVRCHRRFLERGSSLLTEKMRVRTAKTDAAGNVTYKQSTKLVFNETLWDMMGHIIGNKECPLASTEPVPAKWKDVLRIDFVRPSHELFSDGEHHDVLTASATTQELYESGRPFRDTEEAVAHTLAGLSLGATCELDSDGAIWGKRCCGTRVTRLLLQDGYDLQCLRKRIDAFSCDVLCYGVYPFRPFSFVIVVFVPSIRPHALMRLICSLTEYVFRGSFTSTWPRQTDTMTVWFLH
jgi:hypothetical protein